MCGIRFETSAIDGVMKHPAGYTALPCCDWRCVLRGELICGIIILMCVAVMARGGFV